MESEALRSKGACEQPHAPDQLDAARAQAYGLLSVLLARAPSPDLLRTIAALDPDTSTWGQALRLLSTAAAQADAVSVKREYERLFIGLQRGELVPYASYYKTGFLYDRPLIMLRNDMARHGIQRANTCGEPEDHIGAILDMMAGLILGRFVAPFGATEQSRFVRDHLAGWAPAFFSDLQHAESARFYKAVGAAGAIFMEIEHDATTFED